MSGMYFSVDGAVMRQTATGLVAVWRSEEVADRLADALNELDAMSAQMQCGHEARYEYRGICSACSAEDLAGMDMQDE